MPGVEVNRASQMEDGKWKMEDFERRLRQAFAKNSPLRWGADAITLAPP